MSASLIPQLLQVTSYKLLCFVEQIKTFYIQTCEGSSDHCHNSIGLLRDHGGAENDGHEIAGHEIAGHENGGPKNIV